MGSSPTSPATSMNEIGPAYGSPIDPLGLKRVNFDDLGQPRVAEEPNEIVQRGADNPPALIVLWLPSPGPLDVARCKEGCATAPLL